MTAGLFARLAVRATGAERVGATAVPRPVARFAPDTGDRADAHQPTTPGLGADAARAGVQGMPHAVTGRPGTEPVPAPEPSDEHRPAARDARGPDPTVEVAAAATATAAPDADPTRAVARAATTSGQGGDEVGARRSPTPRIVTSPAAPAPGAADGRADSVATTRQRQLAARPDRDELDATAAAAQPSPTRVVASPVMRAAPAAASSQGRGPDPAARSGPASVTVHIGQVDVRAAVAAPAAPASAGAAADAGARHPTLGLQAYLDGERTPS